ncbi:MAG: hypothetical protein L0Y72_00010 [Gemmataceae bacterium]|nr:hypothetical protein [Gemmataceae bacterium]MCI0737393.1 hypothetical protein [Gemmataceae bacterium]
MNALANPEVGKYVEKYFCSSFQRVGTFRIVGKQKQGGNVATYFCAPDGRVLHTIPGPVDAQTMLREAKWVVETAKKGIEVSKGDGAAFKAHMRKAHADKLRTEHGLVVQPVTFDPPDPKDNTGPLTYRDPSGQPLAPVLPPTPIDGPDVKFLLMQERSAKAAGAALIRDGKGRSWGLNNQGRAHHLLAAHCMGQIERLYGSVFEGILGERITTRPVEVVHPFPWHARNGKQGG